ncbi:hypothetical protein [Streptomyces agglomeratus]|uniref:hypothetical protein n=1 Tax=Streptomyces agglomeratus TaxID=285458 RepID=UPI003B8A8204
MEQTCVRAVELGLPSLAFTEHATAGCTFGPDPADLEANCATVPRAVGPGICPVIGHRTAALLNPRGRR